MTHLLLDVHLKPRCKGIHVKVNVPLRYEVEEILYALWAMDFIKFEITGEEIVDEKPDENRTRSGD